MILRIMKENALLMLICTIKAHINNHYAINDTIKSDNDCITAQGNL